MKDTMNRFLLVFLMLLAAPSMAGCSDGLPARVQVTGNVTYKGKPLPTGSISFSPKAKGESRPGIAYLHEDGTFEMTTFRANDGMQPGEYLVVIVAYDEGPLSNAEKWRREGKKLIPEKYFKYSTSGLKALIPYHDVELQFNLE